MTTTQHAKALPQFYAIVPAAGVGKRMKATCPKQYLPLLGKTLLEWTLESLIAHPQIHHIILPISPNDEYFKELPIANAPWLTPIAGGTERADSVLSGLNWLAQNSSQFEQEWALVHDAARPCVQHQDITQLLALSSSTHGGILATPVRDTMKRAHKSSSTQVSNHTHNKVAHTVDREQLWHALTPQFFPAAELYQALQTGLTQCLSITDEASAIELQGGEVQLVEGCASNIKVTHPQDLQLAAFYLNNRGSNES